MVSLFIQENIITMVINLGWTHQYRTQNNYNRDKDKYRLRTEPDWLSALPTLALHVTQVYWCKFKSNQIWEQGLFISFPHFWFPAWQVPFPPVLVYSVPVKINTISIPIRANPPLQWKTDTRQNKTIKVSIHEEEKFTASQHDTSFSF